MRERKLWHLIDHVLTAEELKEWLAVPTSTTPPVSVQIVSDSTPCDLVNDHQIRGGRERVVVGPKLPTLSGDPDYRGITLSMSYMANCFEVQIRVADAVKPHLGFYCRIVDLNTNWRKIFIQTE
jgi:hypothetical protein